MTDNPEISTAFPLPQVAALRAIKAFRDYNPEQKIVCPECGSDYVHLVGSGVRGQTDLQLVTGDGLHFVSGLPEDARGSFVVTLFWCEGGHSFARVEQFHKGQTFIALVCLPALFESLPTLWRD